MLRRAAAKLNDWESRLRASFGDDISTPEQRRKAMWHFHVFDHAFLRILWTNFYPVADGVWRSNQPDPKRIRRWHEMGINTIVNLRGTARFAHHLFEKEACDELGMTLINARCYARKPSSREELLDLIEVLKTAPKPFVMHCKSGADRAGLASALYLMVVEGRPVEEAMEQLSLKFVHVKSSATGICDHLFEVYAERNARDPISIEDWIRTEYDADALRASFREKRSKTRSAAR